MNIAFLHVKSHQGNITPLGLTFGLVVACCVFDTIRLKDTLISNKTRKNQLISLIFDMETINKVKQHLRLTLGCHTGFFDHQYLWKERIDTIVGPFLSNTTGIHSVLNFFSCDSLSPCNTQEFGSH